MEPAEKSPPDRTNRAAAERVPQTPGIASFVDNRSGAVAQRKLAEAIARSPRAAAQRAWITGIHNSPRMVAQREQLTGMGGGAAQREGRLAQAAPGRARRQTNIGLPDNLQPGRVSHTRANHAEGSPVATDVVSRPSISAVVQRNIRTGGFEHSANYFINPVNRHTLYSNTASPPPAPQQLYAQTTEFDDDQQVDLNAWQPNVRFLDVQQKSIEFEGNKMMYTTGQNQKQELDLAALKRSVEQPQVPHQGTAPTIGMLGKNDCVAFADALHNAIARAGYVQPLQPADIFNNIIKVQQDYPEAEVGDMMKHIFKDAGRCPYHGATVVAKDAGGIVTLEANVVEEIDRPQFFARGNAAKFVASNEPEADDSGKGIVRGTELEVIKYVSGKPNQDDTDIYRKFETTEPGTYRLRGNVGTTRTMPAIIGDIRPLIIHLLNSSTASAFWKKQTLNPFSDDMPDGITALRNSIHGDLQGAIKSAARLWVGDKPWNRSAATHDFYKLMLDYTRAADSVSLEDVLAGLKDFAHANAL